METKYQYIGLTASDHAIILDALSHLVDHHMMITKDHEFASQVGQLKMRLEDYAIWNEKPGRMLKHKATRNIIDEGGDNHE